MADVLRPDGRARFETAGSSWAERARCGELAAVLSPAGGERRNRFLHGIQLFGARTALRLCAKQAVVLDFGCGTGRFLRFFGARGHTTVGTEITEEMLVEARRFGLPERSVACVTDGVAIPLRTGTVDMIWVCGVLKYSLLEPGSRSRGGARPAGPEGRESARDAAATAEDFRPVYREIGAEMHRVLKPGGWVVNLEMYVDAPVEVFLRDFEEVGFVTRRVGVVQRYDRLEDVCQSPRLPLGWAAAAGWLCAGLRYWFDDARRAAPGLRDYLFVWRKAVP